MDSSSGISSNSSGMQNSASEEDLQQTMDLRKRKRMISNRESARRSRLRKQKHMEELMAQVAELRRQNHQILTSLRATTQHHIAVESENAILRAQEAELSHRLQSLVEIVGFTAAGNDGGYHDQLDGGGSWNCLSQPIMMMAAAAASSFPADAGPACMDLPRLLC
ncbi:bZIP transcription factor 44-like [Salvia miltiorrhiza]|uniref:bZIP transcription factor 44-like n=1 Tax=Salvia miltiorrhiza TaxID=226208 RepID=UPI0025AD7390|nr:bZIP transcription factor 44-like [Salvia miltiorrhiza]